MSFSTWHNYGLGLRTDTIETTIEKVKNFIALSPDLLDKINAFYESENRKFDDVNLDEFLCEDMDCIDDINAAYTGLAAIIAEVIYEKENIELLCCDNFEGEAYCIFPPMYPWNMTQKESSMTENDIKDIFAKYIKLLTDQSLDELGFGYQEVENGG